MRKILVLALCGCCLVLGTGAAPVQEKEKTMNPLSAGVPVNEGMKMLEVGVLAPEFSIKDTDGVPFNSADEKGKKSILLVFWSMFCEPCRFEMPIVQKMHVRYKDAGLDVVAISLDGEPLKNSILGFVKQEGYSFKVLIDELDSKEMFKVGDPYGVAGTPTTYLIDRAGKIAFAGAGRLKEEELEKAIQTVLKR